MQPDDFSKASAPTQSNIAQNKGASQPAVGKTAAEKEVAAAQSPAERKAVRKAWLAAKQLREANLASVAQAPTAKTTDAASKPGAQAPQPAPASKAQGTEAQPAAIQPPQAAPKLAAQPPPASASPSAPAAAQKPAVPAATGAKFLPEGAAPVRAIATQATPKRRHYTMMMTFVAFVILPTFLAILYLYTMATDQYASTVGFSVRAENTSTASDLLGGFSSLVGASTSQDTDVLYEFVRSQDMVAQVDKKLNLRAIYSKPTGDPVFRFPADGTIEDLVSYWSRMVSIAYDESTGLIQIEARAFEAAQAQAIAQAIYDGGSKMINELSANARRDATRYAREDLDIAETRLKATRGAINDYRSRTQIVDPNANVQSQMGILNQLQSQMAEALIQIDMLRATTRRDDPRMTDAELRISVIQKRIAEERQKFSTGGQGIGDVDFGTVVAEFERLIVDRDFAERSYVAAMTALDAAKAEAQRQSRYLAAFIRPTLAETAEYPRRELLSLLIFIFLALGWSVIALIYYSVRDRR